MPEPEVQQLHNVGPPVARWRVPTSFSFCTCPLYFAWVFLSYLMPSHFIGIFSLGPCILFYFFRCLTPPLWQQTRVKISMPPPPKKNRLIKMFVWQGPAPNLDLGPFGPQTQNPEPKTIEVLLFWGCPKIFLSLLSIFLPSPNSPIDRRKNVQSAGFHTCFWYGNIVVPMVFALDHVVHSKHFYPKYSKFFFPSTSEGLNKWYSI